MIVNESNSFRLELLSLCKHNLSLNRKGDTEFPSVPSTVLCLLKEWVFNKYTP